MIQANGNGKLITMIYDAFGNRVAKTVNGVTTRYLVDDLNPTGYPQVVEELVGGSVQRTYAYGLQRIDEIQLIENQWTPSFYVYDGAGSVRQLTDSTGKVTDKYEYDAYGNSFTKSGTTPNNYLYRGEQFDTDLGLYYLRARYYNPATGRFLSRDPLSGNAKIPATLHKYLYVRGNPVNRIDPRGLDAVEDIQLTVRAIEATVVYAKVVDCGISAGLLIGETLLGKAWDGLGQDTVSGGNLAATAYKCLEMQRIPVCFVSFCQAEITWVRRVA